jgi:hypothetical protein
LHQWKRPNWIQSAVQQLKNSAMQWFNLAAQPKYQFLVIGVLHFLGSQFNIFEQFMTAAATSSASFQAVLHKVLTVQGCLLLWSGGQLLNRLRKEWAKTAINSQVVASRANMGEWSASACSSAVSGTRRRSRVPTVSGRHKVCQCLHPPPTSG